MQPLVTQEEIRILYNLFHGHWSTLLLYILLSATPLLFILFTKRRCKISEIRFQQLKDVELNGLYIFAFFLVLSIVFSEIEKSKDEDVISIVNSFTKLIDFIASILVPTWTKSKAYSKIVK